MFFYLKFNYCFLFEIKLMIGSCWVPNAPIVIRSTGWTERTDNGIVEVSIGRISDVPSSYIIIRLDSNTPPSSIARIESDVELNISDVGGTIPSDYIGGSTTLVNNINALFIGSKVVG